METKTVNGLLNETDRLRAELPKHPVDSGTYRDLAQSLYNVSTALCNLWSFDACCRGASVGPEYHLTEPLNREEEQPPKAEKKPKKAEPVKAEPTKAEPAPIVEEPYVAPEDTAPFEAPAEAAPATEAAYTLEDIRNATKQALAAKKLTNPKEFFERFGATKASDVPTDKYAEFMAALEEL